MCCMPIFYDFTVLLTYFLNDRLNTQNEAAKRGLERLEKQMKVCSYYLLFNMYAFLNKSDA